MAKGEGGDVVRVIAQLNAFITRVVAPSRRVTAWLQSIAQPPRWFDAKLQALFAHVLREWSRPPGDATVLDVHRFVIAWARFVSAETNAARLDAARIMVCVRPFISPYFRRPAVTRAVRALPERDAAGRDRDAQVREVLARALCDVLAQEACRPQRLRRGERGPYIKALGGGFTRAAPDQPAIPVPKGTIIPVIPVFRFDVVELYRFLRHRTKKRAAAYLLTATGYAPKEIRERPSRRAGAAHETAALALAGDARLEAEDLLRRVLAAVPTDKRELVALRAAGEPYRVIAARLGYPTPGAARTDMCRVLDKLRRAGVGV